MFRIVSVLLALIIHGFLWLLLTEFSVAPLWIVAVGLAISLPVTIAILELGLRVTFAVARR